MSADRLREIEKLALEWIETGGDTDHALAKRDCGRALLTPVRAALAKSDAPAPRKLDPDEARGLVEAVAREAVELAIVRSELKWDESLEQSEADIAQDAADALFGDGTCADEPTHSAKQLIAMLMAEQPPASVAEGGEK